MLSSSDKLKEKHRKAFQLWQKVKDAEKSDNKKLQKCFDLYLKELLLKYEMEKGWYCTVCLRHYIQDKLSYGSIGYYSKIYCFPYDLSDLLKHFDNRDHQRFMNIEYSGRGLPKPFPNLTETSSNLPSSSSSTCISHLPPNSSKSAFIAFSSRRQKPQILDDAEVKKWFILIRKVNLILHESFALKSLKPIVNSLNSDLEVLSSPNQPLNLPIDHLSLQNEIGHLIAEEYRIERNTDVMGVKDSGYSISPDNYKDIRMKEMLDCMVRWLHRHDFSVGNNFLGAERVGGERATGGQVFLAILRLLIRNHLNVFMLDDVCRDGGSNFKGDFRGAVARLQALLHGVAVVTCNWDPIHKFFFLFFFFLKKDFSNFSLLYFAYFSLNKG
jgi:hypothetical protein